jgi:5-methylcytosine-specific restriction endonuclease McrA
MTYSEQLKDTRWLWKRDQILDRDFSICQICMSGKNLNVHHKRYIKGRMAWEYPDIYLITLCEPCHKKEHSIGQIPVDETIDPIVDAYGKLNDNIRLLRDLIRSSNGK